MISVKSPMSGSYKAVFIFSIVMIFAVLLVGAASGSKSVGFGIWYWGYTSWKMYKRDNNALVSLQKFMLWFQAIAFSVALAVLMSSEPVVTRYADVTPLGLLIIGTFSIGVTYLLYRFFLRQQSGSVTALASLKSQSVADTHWEKASRELGSDRHEATWAKSLSISEGDESKAKALYLRLRANSLQANSEFAAKVEQNFQAQEDNKVGISSADRGGNNLLFKVVAIVFGLSVLYAAYDGIRTPPKDSVETPSTGNTSTIQEAPRQSAILNAKAKLCLYRWDDSSRSFVRIDTDISDMDTFTNVMLMRPGKDQYVDNLMGLLRKADAEGNEVLARSITKTIRENVLTVYYPKSLSGDFISALAEEQRLTAKCLD